MRLPLTVHPHSVRQVPSRVEVSVERPDAGSLIVDYAVHGGVSRLRLPAPLPPERADDLWQHSCFEIFLRQKGESGYFEFNFAPSTCWAAYRFGGYRSDRTDADVVAPQIATATRGSSYRLRAMLSGLPQGSWMVGLSAILETNDGCKSYWALSHPEGQPDFHHSDCFALELGPAG